MRAPPAPIRFLILVIGGWGALRSVMLMPDWSAAAPGPEAPAAPARAAAVAPVSAPLERAGERSTTQSAAVVRLRSRAKPTAEAAPKPSVIEDPAMRTRLPPSIGWALARGTPRPLAPTAVQPGISVSAGPGRSRWAFSAWLFYRQDGQEAALAPGGALGGSQIGARASYALRRRGGSEVALSARFYAPLDDRRAAEGSVGVDWKPLSAVPVRLLAERRQALGRDGRSGFSITAYGGVDDAPIGPLRLDAYGQAGAVGARRRDLFADGAARLTVPVGPLRIGGGAWAAVQPGVSRLDAGPHADLRLRAGRGAVALSADWRFRLAGNARPGSGPALTLSTGF